MSEHAQRTKDPQQRSFNNSPRAVDRPGEEAGPFLRDWSKHDGRRALNVDRKVGLIGWCCSGGDESVRPRLKLIFAAKCQLAPVAARVEYDVCVVEAESA